MKVILKMHYSSGEEEEIVFNGRDTFIVGRAKTNTHSQLRGDRYISRHHFILEISPPHCFLKDLGSTNGTKVNGVKLSKGDTVELSSGDEIYVGRTTLNIDIQQDSPQVYMAKEIELRCVECDSPVTYKGTDKRSDSFTEAIYCEKCSQKEEKTPLLKINRTWFEAIKDVIREWPNKIDLYRLEQIVEKRFTREELIFKLGRLNFTEKQTEMILKHAVDYIEPVTCSGCNKNMTEMANKDGKRDLPKSSDIKYFCYDCRPEADKSLKPYKLGDYELIKVLGYGGMGAVYKAWHILTGRIVALKKILPQAAMDEKGYKLFKREIAVMARLSHPNIVHFYEYGRIGDVLYFVTEFMNGEDPAELIKKKMAPLDYKLACNIVCQALEGLEFAHSKNYIHRDIKPENILLSRDKTGLKAKLSDFGLAKNFQDAGGSMLTQEKEFMGTLLFMPPEQLRNYRYVKPPTDIYSMGVTLYYLLTGKYIFNYPSPLDILKAERDGKKINLNRYEDPLFMVLGTSPIPVEKQNSNIPPELASVVNKSIRKKEKDRYLTAKDFREDIMRAADL